MNHRNSVITALKMFSDSYPGKFSVGNNVSTWERVLFGIDPDVIPIAALHIVSTRKDWPPDPATMREQCINMSHGQLSDPTGSEAWERILEKINRKDVQLTDLEKKALSQTKSIYDMRQAGNIDSDRARYIDAFEKLVAKRKLERQTLPEVKALVAKNAPALPEPKRELPPAREPEYEDPAKVKELISGVVNQIGDVE